MIGSFFGLALSLFIFLTLFQGYTQASFNELFSDTSLTQTDEQLLTLRLELPIRSLRKETNDSTYMSGTLYYKLNSKWDSVPVELRTRGKFRLKMCIFPPIKLKFSKEDIKGTIFEGNEKIKLVVPCEQEDTKNDYILNEFIAYKIFEPITPYHFKTRLANLEWAQKKSKKRDKGFELKCILLEEIDNLAERVDGKEYDHWIHPMTLDTLNAIRNAFFQYMIGNKDYSVVLGHNRKALYIDNKFVTVPYDFDMSGIVNADYGKSSDVQDLSLGDDSTTRIYREFPRQKILIQQIRQEYLRNKPVILNTMDKCEKYFDNKYEFDRAKTYVLRFYQILEDDKAFYKQFIKRSKSG